MWGEREAYWALRDQYEAAHPDYAAFRAWRSTVLDTYGDTPEALARFRAEYGRANPNAGRYFASLDGPLLDGPLFAQSVKAQPGTPEHAAARDAKTTGLDAYIAAQGWCRRLGDPDPLPVNDPTTTPAPSSTCCTWT